MDGLRNFIITLSTALIFITAIEIIVPNNALKKYVKFVLGLILISIVLNPIIKIINKESYIDYYNREVTSFFNEDETKTDYYKNTSIENTKVKFKDNLETVCNNKLKEEYKDNKTYSDFTIDYDEENRSFYIESIDIYVIDNEIKAVEKVDLDNKEESILLEDGEKYKNFVSLEFSISKDIILVYKG
ncbi:MAG: stage III sporulation protein AF [Clostridiaceae bacterium]